MGAMGANSALLRHYYGVCFDRNMSLNNKSMCKLYKLNNHSEHRATVSVLRELIYCGDGINTVDCLTYDEITLTIEELCTN